MTFEDYRRNVRGVNDGSDFPVDYLVQSSITKGGDTRLLVLLRKTYMTAFARAKLSFQKNTQDNLALNMHGKSS
jgi:hypothetical protein